MTKMNNPKNCITLKPNLEPIESLIKHCAPAGWDGWHQLAGTGGTSLLGRVLK